MNIINLRFASLIVVYLRFVFPLLAQYPDNNWLLGYEGGYGEDDGFGLVQLDFTNNQLTVGEEMEVVIDLDRNISIISTLAGDSILFYFNGLQVNNGTHELAVNGGEMYYGELSLGYNPRQGSLILPMPDHPDEYVLFSTFYTQDLETF